MIRLLQTKTSLSSPFSVFVRGVYNLAGYGSIRVKGSKTTVHDGAARRENAPSPT